jgi:hypothetical protein
MLRIVVDKHSFYVSHRGKSAKDAGLKKSTDFSKSHRNSAGSIESDFKNHRFLKFKFRNFRKKLENYVKKLDEILRTSLEKKFQISTVLLDKIQIELKT